MYYSTDDEAYQVFNCNVETHEDWIQTSRDVDIIYPSGSECELRIMYELSTHKNYFGRETATNQMVYGQWLTLSGA